MSRTAALIIGRNEGVRFEACLASLPEGLVRVIYVDSGSTDGSVEAAKAFGAEVVALDMDQPFTAARAQRGAGAVGGRGHRLCAADRWRLRTAGWLDCHR
jgi:hypothetical protein